jgi:NAD(P)-dependent dehydrogenase (short-subunit alcohol dehydrogenase family)
MELGLAGQVAVVTGASKGIGLAVTQALVREGVRVIAGARGTSEELDKLVAGGAVQAVQVDLGRPDAPARLVAAAGDRIDILVNNVGAAHPRLKGFLEVTDEEWLTSLNINLMAAVRTTRAVLPLMLDAGKGAIVNIGSVNASLPDPAVIDYSAAKAALANFAKSLSKEVGARGVRVNTVDPGPVATALWLGDTGVAETIAAATGQLAADVAAQAAGDMVTGRFTQPREVADLVLMLAGDRIPNVTGASFTIDGGLIKTL